MKKNAYILLLAILAGGLVFTSCTKKYTITVKSNNDSYGTVTGGGEYEKNATAVITAIPNAGHSFQKWDDGNTENPRTVTVVGNATYTAVFETTTYTITVNANNDAYGEVTGGGQYEEFATAVLTAIPNSGYVFQKWDDGNTDNPRSVTVTGDATYTAVFSDPLQYGVTITFQNNTWKAANAVGVDHTDDNYITFYFYKVANSDENPYTQGFLESHPGTFDYEGTGGDIMHYRDPNYIFTDVDNVLGQGAGTQFWGWFSLTETFVEHITAVDLNALTISGDWSVEVGSVETYATTGGDWGTTYPFTGVMNNVNWSWAGKGLNVKKAKGNNIQKVR